MKGARRQLWLVLLAILVSGGTASAQTTSAPKVSAIQPNLVAAERQKAATRQVLLLQTNEVTQAQQKHEQLRQLVAEGFVARIELEESERSLNDLQTRLETTRLQVAATDKVILEIRAAEELAKTQPKKAAGTSPRLRSLTTPTILRYGGSAGWSLGNLAVVQNFFVSKFGRSLPTSAVGQSATHNRLGYDHRHAVDVPLHPDSAEGRALINFLQSNGIPFLAFRAAIAGVATGPHIHIGTPSHRLG